MNRVAATVLGPSETEGFVSVIVDRALACERCAAGKGCGAGLFQRGTTEIRLDVRLPAGMSNIQPGERLELELAPRRLLEAALTVYGLPLAGAASFALLAHVASLGEVGAVLAALAGLIAGVLLGRARIGRAGCLDRLVPEVLAREAASG